MGRQPFLTRLALGRSPFEPTESIVQSESSAYVQIDTSQQDASTVTQAFSNRYVQLYDERGSPVNPRAHDHGRRLRQAQNDVLSSIGVVERRPSPSDLPGAYKERLEQLHNEDLVGSAVALVSTLTENTCTWWLGSLRDRLLTFRYRDTVFFTRIAAREYQRSGPMMIYAGFPGQLLFTASVQAFAYVAYMVRPVDRLLNVTHATRKTKNFFQQWKNVSRTCFRVLAVILSYPLAYHASLQRLGLIPARPFFPPWKAFIPLSSLSPIQPLHLPHGLSLSAVPAILTSAATSPLLFVCLEHILERWVYAIIYEAVETAVIRPNNPDLPPPDDGAKDRATAMLGLRHRSPSTVRSFISKSLFILGWGEPLQPENSNSRSRRSDESTDTWVRRPVEVGGRQITNINRLDISPTQPADTGTGVPAPPSPSVSEGSQHNDDPRIRITSREGTVEMEVRLPPRVLSSHTEVAEPESTRLHDVTSPAYEPTAKPYHRVTQLSTEPALMIGAICKAQLVGWATVPLRLVTFRLVAGHFLRGHQDRYAGSSLLSPYGIFTSVHNGHPLQWRSTGLLLSRLVLCGALEIAIDLGLWSVQWVAVTWFGRKHFGWGSL